MRYIYNKSQKPAILAQKQRFWLCLGISLALVSPIFADKTAQPQALNSAGIYQLRQVYPELQGQGLDIAVICRSQSYSDGIPLRDYCPSLSHRSLIDASVAIADSYNDNSTSEHSTAICSILFGFDPNASAEQVGEFEYEGVTPAANGIVHEFRDFLADYIFPQVLVDADVVTISFGSQFEDWWTRGIEAIAEQQGTVFVASIGNGTESLDPPLYPGACGNVIGVGLVNSLNTNDLATELESFTLAYPQYSSSGPTEDKRCKPDIVAPGNCLVAAASNANGYEPAGNWSSFSTPVAAGAIGLLIQKAKSEPNDYGDLLGYGGNCAVKAIVMNSAKKLPYWHKGKLTKDDDHNVPLDFVQGAGMVDAFAAYEQLTAGVQKDGTVENIGWDKNTIDVNNIARVYSFPATDSNEALITATLVWNKHLAGKYPFEEMLQSDLRLELWAIDINDANNNYLLDYSDSPADNTEHIYAKADPNVTGYELVVSFSDPNIIDEGENFAIAWRISEDDRADIFAHCDLNGDGVANNFDFAIMLENKIKSLIGNEYLIGDINDDGVIDMADFNIILAYNSEKDGQ
ncbi:MAG: S8 family serine peptidase [Phycisphaerae bacterium]|nr:S8 family serine peptidase [Phycisphaerae bacterium]